LHLQPLLSLDFFDTGPTKAKGIAKKTSLSDVNLTSNDFVALERFL